jgi:Transposase.
MSLPPKKKFKVQTSAGEVMAGIFCDSEGFLLVKFLEIDATVNSKQYGKTLKQLKQRI